MAGKEITRARLGVSAVTAVLFATGGFAGHQVTQSRHLICNSGYGALAQSVSGTAVRNCAFTDFVWSVSQGLEFIGGLGIVLLVVLLILAFAGGDPTFGGQRQDTGGRYSGPASRPASATAPSPASPPPAAVTNPLACAVCGRVFDSADKLGLHVTNFHPAFANIPTPARAPTPPVRNAPAFAGPVPADSSTGTAVCGMCGRWFIDSDKLGMHVMNFHP